LFVVQVVAAFPREDALFSGIQNGVEKLKWSFKWIKSAGSAGISAGSSANIPSSTAADPEPSFSWNSLTDQVGSTNSAVTIDLLLLDYRQPKLLPPDCLNLIR
jgi:hypothetical protein